MTGLSLFHEFGNKCLHIFDLGYLDLSDPHVHLGDCQQGLSFFLVRPTVEAGNPREGYLLQSLTAEDPTILLVIGDYSLIEDTN